jgi:hypothetical protein
METLGSLYDKYTIACIRSDALEHSEYKTDELIKGVSDQKRDLAMEIESFLISAGRRRVKLQELKYKMYKGESPSGVKFNSIKAAEHFLLDTNRTLWKLEDNRRDKTKSDAEIRQICDDVAKHNRMRNDTIDQINILFVSASDGDIT